MANFTASNLVKAQVALNGEMAKADSRIRVPAVHNLFAQQGSSFFPNYQELRKREDRTIEAAYRKRAARSLGTGRTHNHTGVKGDSGVLTPTFTTRNDKFNVSLKQDDNNVLQDSFNYELINSVKNFMEGLDTVASDKLVNSRSGVNVAAAEGTFDATNDVFEITETTNGARAAQIAKTVMDINKYQGMPLFFVCDSISFNKFQFYAAQGASNATNYSFQFMGMTFVHDPSLTAKAVVIDATYTKGFFEVFANGTIGMLDWIPKQNREGIVTSVNKYSAINNPFDGLQYALHSYETRADDSANNGYTQDVVTQFELSIDLAHEVAPLSTATETPIFAFALV